MLQSQYYFNLTFISVIPPSLIFFSPFRCNFNSIISNIIYSICLYLISSIKAEPHYPPEAIRHSKNPPIIFKPLQCFSLSTEKI